MANNENLKPFKKGYDPRRWVKGRSPLSPEQKEGEKILLAVIWEELSREFDTNGMKPLETPETIDALRLMVRTWIKKKPELIAERIAGKVPASLELTGKDGGGLKVIVEYVDETHQTPETTRGTAADQSDPQEA
jgi:hypothetical protein